MKFDKTSHEPDEYVAAKSYVSTSLKTLCATFLVMGFAMLGGCETAGRVEMWASQLPDDPPYPIRVEMDPALPGSYQNALEIMIENLGYSISTSPIREGGSEYVLSFEIKETTDLFARQFSQCHIRGVPDPDRPGFFKRCGERLPSLHWWVVMKGYYADGIMNEHGEPKTIYLADRTKIRWKNTPYEGGPIEYAEVDLANTCRLLFYTQWRNRNSQQMEQIMNVIKGPNTLASRACFDGLFFDKGGSPGDYDFLYKHAFNHARSLMLEGFRKEDEEMTITLLRWQNPEDPDVKPLIETLTLDHRPKIKAMAEELMEWRRPRVKCSKYWSRARCVERWEQ